MAGKARSSLSRPAATGNWLTCSGPWPRFSAQPCPGPYPCLHLPPNLALDRVLFLMGKYSCQFRQNFLQNAWCPAYSMFCVWFSQHLTHTLSILSTVYSQFCKAGTNGLQMNKLGVFIQHTCRQYLLVSALRCRYPQGSKVGWWQSQADSRSGLPDLKAHTHRLGSSIAFSFPLTQNGLFLHVGVCLIWQVWMPLSHFYPWLLTAWHWYRFFFFFNEMLYFSIIRIA